MSCTILYKLMRRFHPNPDDVPELLRAAGVHIVRHRQPSSRMHVFHGVVLLGQGDTLIKFAMGMTPTIGGIMSLRATDDVCMKETTSLSAAADVWFCKHWSAPVD